MEYLAIEKIFEYIHQAAGLLTPTSALLIAVIGWIVTLIIQRHAVKHQHRAQIKYDIYKQLVETHKEVQDVLGKLNAKSRPPFILMRSSLIPHELKLKKEYKGQWIPYSEQECMFEGEQKWTAFTRDLYDSYSAFTNVLIKMQYITEDWAAPLKPLLSTRDVFFQEIEQLKEKIRKRIEFLQSYTSDHGHDWRNWNESEVEQTTQEIGETTMTIGSYVHDLMVLIHNELLSSYFGYRRPIRKTLDPKFKVLTKQGIIENVDRDLVKASESCKATIISFAKRKLEKKSKSDDDSAQTEKLKLLSMGRCPDCKTPLWVVDMKKHQGNFHLLYACGHAWKKVPLKETSEIERALRSRKFSSFLSKFFSNET